jgi:hypothetical protein
MGKRCLECGAENLDTAEKCGRCGAAFPAGAEGDVEIEIYDVASVAEDKSGYFEETLAATRASVRRNSHEPPADFSNDPLIQEELRSGYEIRKRRLGHRLPHSRHIVIITVVAAAHAAAGVYGVRWAGGRLPTYEYAEPAHVAPTDLALELAAELEAAKVELVAAEASEATAVLAVGGESGKVFVDGNYVADVPASDIRVPPGRHHVIVRKGSALTLDETIDFREKGKYSLEPTGAAALAGTR